MHPLRRAGLLAIAALGLPVLMLPSSALTAGEPAASATRPSRISPPKRLEAQEDPGPSGTEINAAAVPRAVRQAVVADAARRFAVDESAVVVSEAEQVTWPDGSLGCPQPGMMYTQVLVPGYRLTARTAGGSMRYHADSRGNVATCAFVPHASRPVKGASPGVAPRTAPPAATAPDR
jgi:hypothetical protein